MNGFKTLAGNIVAILMIFLSMRGIEFTPEQQLTLLEFATYALAAGNLALRHITKGKAGWRK